MSAHRRPSSEPREHRLSSEQDQVGQRDERSNGTRQLVKPRKQSWSNWSKSARFLSRSLSTPVHNIKSTPPVLDIPDTVTNAAASVQSKQSDGAFHKERTEPQGDIGTSFSLPPNQIQSPVNFYPFDTSDEIKRLRTENDNIRDKMRDLLRENEMLVAERDELGLKQENLEAANYELDKLCGEMTIEMRGARVATTFTSESSVVTGFQELFRHVGAWCDEASYKAGPIALCDNQIVELCKILELKSPVTRTILQVGAPHFGRALLFRTLVDAVFYSDFDDLKRTKDLWATFEDAQLLSFAEQRMINSDLTSEEICRWLTLTVKALSSHSSMKSDRLKALDGQIWDYLAGLYGLLDCDSAAQMRADLNTSVLTRAVKFSRTLRTVRSRVWVSYPSILNLSNSVNITPNLFHFREDKWKHEEGRAVDSLELLMRPGVFLEYFGADGMQQDQILFRCEKANLIVG